MSPSSRQRPPARRHGMPRTKSIVGPTSCGPQSRGAMMAFHRRAKCRYWACRWPLIGQAICFPAIAEAHAPAIVDDIVGLARVAVVDEKGFRSAAPPDWHAL